jgi:hypothetical protein
VPSNRLISRAVLCVIACALLGATFSATAGAADRVAAARAQARYHASFGQELSPADKVAAARAQGRYYASFRHSKPLAPPQSHSGETPWVLTLIGLAIALLIVGAVTIEVRRLGVRRRAARVSTPV